jgi:hypothetical protein
MLLAAGAAVAAVPVLLLLLLLMHGSFAAVAAAAAASWLQSFCALLVLRQSEDAWLVIPRLRLWCDGPWGHGR